MNRYIIFVGRSGSTYFGQRLAQTNNCKWYGDFLNPGSHRTIDQCIQDFNSIKSLGKSDYVAKISSWQWENASYHTNTDVLKQIVKLADKFYFLIRGDYNRQLQSYYASMLLRRKYNFTFMHEFDQEIVLQYNEQEYKKLDVELRNRYQKSADLFLDTNIKQPKELVFFEDFQTPEQRLKRNFTFNEDIPKVDFCPKKLFGLLTTK